MLTGEKILQETADLLEIQSVLTPYQHGGTLDRVKAEQIIRKHNSSDIEVALMNSPLNPGFITFERATDRMVAENLAAIQRILGGKLMGKSINEIIGGK